jgi:hypothetical protein
MRLAFNILIPSMVCALVAMAAEPMNGWQPLFDGKTLDGWQATDFFKPGHATVAEGAIRLTKGMERAGPMTGITSTRKDLPKIDYELRYKARRVDGRDFFATVTFPVGDSHCSFVTGGWGGQTIGLSNLDSADASENETSSNFEFATGQWYDFRVRVSKDRIESWINTKKVVDVVTTDRRLGIRIECYPSRPLGLATYRTTSEIKDVAVRKLTTEDLAEISKLPKP